MRTMSQLKEIEQVPHLMANVSDEIEKLVGETRSRKAKTRRVSRDRSKPIQNPEPILASPKASISGTHQSIVKIQSPRNSQRQRSLSPRHVDPRKRSKSPDRRKGRQRTPSPGHMLHYKNLWPWKRDSSSSNREKSRSRTRSHSPRGQRVHQPYQKPVSYYQQKVDAQSAFVKANLDMKTEEVQVTTASHSIKTAIQMGLGSEELLERLAKYSEVVKCYIRAIKSVAGIISNPFLTVSTNYKVNDLLRQIPKIEKSRDQTEISVKKYVNIVHYAGPSDPALMRDMINFGIIEKSKLTSTENSVVSEKSGSVNNIRVEHELDLDLYGPQNQQYQQQQHQPSPSHREIRSTYFDKVVVDCGTDPPPVPFIHHDQNLHEPVVRQAAFLHPGKPIVSPESEVKFQSQGAWGGLSQLKKTLPEALSSKATTSEYFVWYRSFSILVHNNKQLQFPLKLHYLSQCVDSDLKERILKYNRRISLNEITNPFM